MKVLRTFLIFLAVAGGYGQQPRKPGLYAIFHTAMGDFTAVLYAKDTPHTVQTFVGLATGLQPWLDPESRKPVKRPLYNDSTFYRVVPGDMIQAGDPTGKGTHNCGFTIRDEILPGLRFERGGVLAMANTGQPDTGGCQFFITVGPMPVWNGKYTIFGQVVEGLDVVNKINHGPVHEDRPLNPVKLESVTIQREGPPPKGK